MSWEADAGHPGRSPDHQEASLRGDWPIESSAGVGGSEGNSVWIPQSIKGEELQPEGRLCTLGQGWKHAARSGGVSCSRGQGTCSRRELPPCSNSAAGGCGEAGEECSYSCRPGPELVCGALGSGASVPGERLYPLPQIRSSSVLVSGQDTSSL